MLRNMFIIAWRNALRNKQFTILNLLGLSIGVSAFLLITLYVIDETSYDAFHKDTDQVYRINQPMIWGDWDAQFASTGPGVAVALREDIPEFTEVTRIHDPGQQIITYNPTNDEILSFQESQAYVAEGNFFQLFSFPLLDGDPQTALVDPLSVVITKNTAKKYFGEDEAMGKILEIRQGQNSGRFKVTGVLENIPTNSHIQFDLLTSMSTYQEIKNREWQWVWTTYVTYAKVAPGADIQKIEEKLQAIPPKWAAVAVERSFGESFENFVPDGKKWTLTMQPIREAYLHSPVTGNRIGPAGSIAYVQIFSAIGIFVLVLSCINFMNLSTARSANRAKEVGVRKVLGSNKKSLIQQFIFESVLFTAVSTILAIVLSELFIGSFNAIANKSLSFESQLTPQFFVLILLFIVALGFLAGSYPAFYLSSFQPIHILKGKMNSGFKGKGIRNTLVIFQFTISIALIISTFFVQKQLNYTANYNLGFEKENILQIEGLEQLHDESAIEAFQNRLAMNPAFKNVGYSDLIPPNIFNEDKYKAEGPENDPITLNRLIADEDYIDMLAPKFILGRNFDDTRTSDKYAVVLNASAVKALGYGTPDQYNENSPLGKYVTFPTSEADKFEIIGVMEDFNYNSLKLDIQPLMIAHKDNEKMFNMGTRYISARLNTAVIQNTKQLSLLIDEVEESLREVKAGIPFEYSFMDQEFESSFRTEQRMGQVLNIFTIMALSIACLGLFGLAAFSAEQRVKELGVRKVLGASAKDLVIMFSSEFSKLVIVSIIIASPLAYYAVSTWLSGFAYQTPISLSVFLLAGGCALIIAWFTISFQSLRAANRNPVESLRDE